MGAIALVCMILLNLVTSYSFLKKEDYPNSWIWFFYAVATVGFLWAYLKDKNV